MYQYEGNYLLALYNYQDLEPNDCTFSLIDIEVCPTLDLKLLVHILTKMWGHIVAVVAVRLNISQLPSNLQFYVFWVMNYVLNYA